MKAVKKVRFLANYLKVAQTGEWSDGFSIARMSKSIPVSTQRSASDFEAKIKSMRKPRLSSKPLER